MCGRVLISSIKYRQAQLYWALNVVRNVNWKKQWVYIIITVMGSLYFWNIFTLLSLSHEHETYGKKTVKLSFSDCRHVQHKIHAQILITSIKINKKVSLQLEEFKVSLQYFRPPLSSSQWKWFLTIRWMEVKKNKHQRWIEHIAA